MSRRPRRSWHSFHATTALYWLPMLLLVVAAADILAAVVAAVRGPVE